MIHPNASSNLRACEQPSLRNENAPFAPFPWHLIRMGTPEETREQTEPASSNLYDGRGKFHYGRLHLLMLLMGLSQVFQKSLKILFRQCLKPDRHDRHG
jgi:hypothetical protein